MTPSMLRHLGYVDEHDDTYFNRSQMRRVIPELERLAGFVSQGEADAVQQLLDLARSCRPEDRSSPPQNKIRLSELISATRMC